MQDKGLRCACLVMILILIFFPDMIYYFNFSTGESTWDHPNDGYYKRLYEMEKEKKEILSKVRLPPLEHRISSRLKKGSSEDTCKDKGGQELQLLEKTNSKNNLKNLNRVDATSSAPVFTAPKVIGAVALKGGKHRSEQETKLGGVSTSLSVPPLLVINLSSVQPDSFINCFYHRKHTQKYHLS
jgi:hypothetical protein